MIIRASMRHLQNTDIERIRINPGEYYVANRNVILSTILGSCVSACLYDPMTNIIGMNHFLLSNRRYTKELPSCITEAGRYGIHAMELLINEMMKLGARRSNLLAKAFGGGAVLPTAESGDNFFCVGDVNVRFIREFLKDEGIPLVSSDLGGDSGRVVHFCFEEYAVYMRKIKKTLGTKVASEEKQFWQRSIEKQEKTVSKPDIWL